VRNIFDQYNQQENRLTHALAVCLNEDRALLRRFLARVAARPPEGARLVLGEQALPGDAPETDEHAERKGLPDIVIHDDAGWCLVIESKVQAALSRDQLERHKRTLRRRGFDRVECLALTKAGVRVPRGAGSLTWPELYEWLGRSGRGSDWAERLRSYLRAAEVRLAQEEYLTEGTLTMFDGFPFSEESPYTYGEAKRLLNLATAQLKRDRSLKKLGMDARGLGRGKITGRDAGHVWDYLSLRDRPTRGTFTSYPHLTVSMNAAYLGVAVTVPNGVVREVRQRLIALGSEGLVALNAKVLRRARRLVSRGARVEAYAMQRHYRSQSSAGIVDAVVSFDLATSLPRGRGKVKHQPEWVGLLADLLRRKRSNVQFGYSVHLPWGTRGLDSRASLGLIAQSWIAMKPLLDVVRGD
jgi:hypothetical protein